MKSPTSINVSSPNKTSSPLPPKKEIEIKDFLMMPSKCVPLWMPNTSVPKPEEPPNSNS